MLSNNKKCKLISLLLSIVLLVCVLPKNVLAKASEHSKEFDLESLDNGTIDDSTMLDYSSEEKQGSEDIELMLAQDPLFAAKDSLVLNYIDKNEFANNRHIKRLASEECLNTYVFLNDNGTRTAYVLAENIKYIQDDGEICEKDNTLVDKQDYYDVASNEYSLRIPKSISEGIRFNYHNCCISITPQNINRNVFAEKKDGSIIYHHVFGEGISLRYTPLLSGLKEDIILEQYASINYSFIVDTNGLFICAFDGQFYFARQKEMVSSDQALLRLGEIEVFDAVGQMGAGSIDVKPISEGSQYLVSVSVANDFLCDEKTVYPIIIDPTIQDTSSTNGLIEDCPVYSGKPSNNYASYYYLNVGYTGDTYKIGRVAFRLPGLSQFISQNYLGINDIDYVGLRLRDSSGHSNRNIRIYPITTNWTESTATWNSIGNALNTGSYWDYSLGSDTELDITLLAKGWLAPVYSMESGFMIVNNDETSTSNKKSPYSSEYSTVSYRPYVRINYTRPSTGLISLNYNTKTITSGSSSTLTATTTLPNAIVAWSSSNTGVATVTANGNQCTINALHAGNATIRASVTNSDGITEYAECMLYVYITGGVYYVKNFNSACYLTMSSDIEENLTTYQYSLIGSPDTNKIRQMWYISHLGGGKYTIRPYYRRSRYLYAYGGSVKTCEGSTVTNEMKWKIEWVNGNYVIKNCQNGYYSMQIDNGSTVTGANVVVGTYTSSSRWVITKVSSPPSGIYFYDRIHSVVVSTTIKCIDPSTTCSLIDLDLIAVPYTTYTENQNMTSWESSDTSIATVDNSGAVTGVSPGVATITAKKYCGPAVGYKQATYELKINNNAIIIIPGIMATELVAGSNNSTFAAGTKLWSKDLFVEYSSNNLSVTELVERIISLRCDSDGNSINDIVPYNNSFGVDNAYQYLYNSLNNAYQNRYAVEFFAYDWRLSNAVSANMLNNFINDNNFDYVVLVCHSMGGLVASGFLSLGESQRAKVKSVITLGSPLLGTPVVPYLWGSENINFSGSLDLYGLPSFALWAINIITDLFNPLDYLMGNFSSMYEMFPSEKYFDSSYAGKHYLITSIIGNTLTITTYAETRGRLDNFLPHYNTDLADAAEDFHDSLYTYNSHHITNFVNTYYIAGFGKDTIDQIEFDMLDWYIDLSNLDGDELVGIESATLGDKYSGRTFFVQNVSHMDLIYSSEVQSFITQLIDGNTSTNAFEDIFADCQ